MKIRTSVIAKIIAWVIIAVSGLGMVGSVFLAIRMESEGFYARKFPDLREEQFMIYSDRYSVRVLDYLYAEEDTNQEYFADKNFRYGVIEADFWSDIENLDLNDKSIYIDSNFDEPVSLEDLHVFQCAINENTIFHSNNPDSLLGYYRVSNTADYWNTYEISEFVYDTTSGIVFCRAADTYYPVPKILFSIYPSDAENFQMGYEFNTESTNYRPVDVEKNPSFGKQEDGTALEIEIYTEANSESLEKLLADMSMAGVEEGLWFLWFEGTELGVKNWYPVISYGSQESYGAEEEVILEESMGMAPSDVTDTTYTYDTDMGSANRMELTYDALAYKVSSQNMRDEVRLAADGMHVYVRPENMKSTGYFVLSYQKDEFFYNSAQMLSETDVYAKYDIFVGTLYSMRYQVFGIFFGCLAVFAAAFIFLCCCAGHRKGQSELAESRMNRVPLEIYAAAVGAIWILLILVLDAVLGRVEVIDFRFVFLIVGAIAAVLFAGLSLTAAGLEVVTRIKLRIFWKYTVIYWIISRLFGGCKKMVSYLREHTSMMVHTILFFAVIFAAEIVSFIIMAGEGIPGLVLLLLVNGILFIVLLAVVIQLQKLKEAGKHVASGDLSYKIDTGSMFWEFKEHGENLNRIGDGLSHAVEERMKSERFKTELITNVSHDIKTPLTSIINYVDLLQKEEVNNEKVQEYLEVLERQSARLKKLLEDLLEASKASAGTLQVECETLEAGVFMVQTVGEFEEKTRAQDLELIIKKPEEPVYIRADGRHFWRVIDNLMNNICKYAQPNTRVYINLEATAQEAHITFRNTSRYPLNISSDELMERFVRGDSSRNTEGSGLGLSITRSLMELMHGKCELVIDGDLFKVILVFDRVSEL